MTGEITLTGRVLKIGGLKEKSLAAYRAGIKDMIVPEGNRSDVSELPSVVKHNIEFHYADNIKQVLPYKKDNSRAADNPQNGRALSLVLILAWLHLYDYQPMPTNPTWEDSNLVSN